MKIKANIIFFITISLCLCFPIICNAATSADTSYISQIVKVFNSELSKYENVMLKYAKQLFYWCAVLEVAWLGIKMALGTSDIRETIKNFCFVLLAAGFFLAVINNYHTWAWNLINGLKDIAGEVGNTTNSSDNPFKAGLDIAVLLFKKISITEVGISIGYIATVLIILICFTLITAQIVFIKCECIIAMCASSILIGLGASSIMRDYAINVLKYIVSVAFKLMVMQIVIGVGMNFISELKSVNSIDMAQCLVSIGVAIVLYALVKQLPDTVAGIIQGSHVSSGQALTSTVMAMGAGMMGAGMAMGSGVANVGRAALAAKAQGAEGVGGMVRGTASNLWNATREASHEKGLRQGSVASSLRARIESARTEAAKSQGKKD